MNVLNSISNDFIEKAIADLINSLGIKDNISVSEYEGILHNQGLKELIRTIATQIGLPVDIKLTFIPSHYTSGVQYYGTQALSTTDSRGRGIEYIAAQVSIPNYIPPYGTPALNNFPIEVKVSENCNKKLFILLAVLSHEFSHILLHSLHHPEKENEFITDLTSMILGFSEVIEKGRKNIEIKQTESQEVRYGYLADDQFIYAKNKIQAILRECKDIRGIVLGKVTKLGQTYFRLKKALFQFKEYLSYLDTKRKRSIKKNDTEKIIKYHLPEYTHKYEKTLKQSEKYLKDIREFLQQITHYTSNNISNLYKYEKNIIAFHRNVEREYNDFANDIKVLERNVGFWTRRKIRKRSMI